MSAGHKGVKDARMELIPTDALWLVGKVFGAGASKYADRNWERGYAWSKSYGAMQRHLALFWAGEDDDPETGLPHIGHAAWHALVLAAFLLRGAGEDDRGLGVRLATMQAEVTNPEEIEAARAEITMTPNGPSVEVDERASCRVAGGQCFCDDECVRMRYMPPEVACCDGGCGPVYRSLGCPIDSREEACVDCRMRGYCAGADTDVFPDLVLEDDEIPEAPIPQPGDEIAPGITLVARGTLSPEALALWGGRTPPES